MSKTYNLSTMNPFLKKLKKMFKKIEHYVVKPYDEHANLNILKELDVNLLEEMLNGVNYSIMTTRLDALAFTENKRLTNHLMIQKHNIEYVLGMKKVDVSLGIGTRKIGALLLLLMMAVPWDNLPMDIALLLLEAVVKENRRDGAPSMKVCEQVAALASCMIPCGASRDGCTDALSKWLSHQKQQIGTAELSLFSLQDVASMFPPVVTKAFLGYVQTWDRDFWSRLKGEDIKAALQRGDGDLMREIIRNVPMASDHTYVCSVCNAWYKLFSGEWRWEYDYEFLPNLKNNWVDALAVLCVEWENRLYNREYDDDVGTARKVKAMYEQGKISRKTRNLTLGVDPKIEEFFGKVTTMAFLCLVEEEAVRHGLPDDSRLGSQERTPRAMLLRGGRFIALQPKWFQGVAERFSRESFEKRNAFCKRAGACFRALLLSDSEEPDSGSRHQPSVNILHKCLMDSSFCRSCCATRFRKVAVSFLRGVEGNATDIQTKMMTMGKIVSGLRNKCIGNTFNIFFRGYRSPEALAGLPNPGVDDYMVLHCSKLVDRRNEAGLCGLRSTEAFLKEVLSVWTVSAADLPKDNNDANCLEACFVNTLADMCLLTVFFIGSSRLLRAMLQTWGRFSSSDTRHHSFDPSRLRQCLWDRLSDYHHGNDHEVESIVFYVIQMYFTADFLQEGVPPRIQSRREGARTYMKALLDVLTELLAAKMGEEHLIIDPLSINTCMVKYAYLARRMGQESGISARKVLNRLSPFSDHNLVVTRAGSSSFKPHDIFPFGLENLYGNSHIEPRVMRSHVNDVLDLLLTKMTKKHRKDEGVTAIASTGVELVMWALRIRPEGRAPTDEIVYAVASWLRVQGIDVFTAVAPGHEGTKNTVLHVLIDHCSQGSQLTCADTVSPLSLVRRLCVNGFISSRALNEVRNEEGDTAFARILSSIWKIQEERIMYARYMLISRLLQDEEIDRAMNDTQRILENLKRVGADVNATNAKGRTPLLQALDEKRYIAASSLLRSFGSAGNLGDRRQEEENSSVKKKRTRREVRGTISMEREKENADGRTSQECPTVLEMCARHATEPETFMNRVYVNNEIDFISFVDLWSKELEACNISVALGGGKSALRIVNEYLSCLDRDIQVRTETSSASVRFVRFLSVHMC